MNANAIAKDAADELGMAQDGALLHTNGDFSIENEDSHVEK